MAGLTTTARKSADGKYYTINGEKKWVTQGRWADHGLVAARTGPAGAKGISVFIVPLNVKGISRRKMENSGVSSSGTDHSHPHQLMSEANDRNRFDVYGV